MSVLFKDLFNFWSVTHSSSLLPFEICFRVHETEARLEKFYKSIDSKLLQSFLELLTERQESVLGCGCEWMRMTVPYSSIG